MSEFKSKRVVLLATLALLMLVFGALPIEAADFNGVKVHYKDMNGTPNIYTWTDTASPSGAWPGSAMESEGDSWYVASFEGYTSLNIIFLPSAGGQSANLSRSQGEWWYKDGVWYASDPEGSSTGESITVHYKDTNGAPNIYTWIDTVKPAGAWPGSAMASEGDSWYVSSFDGYNSLNIIFISSTGGQSADLSRTAGEWWYKDGVWYDTKPGGSNNVASADVDNLRIYQVMVESFQDGDSSRNYGAGYGPSFHNGDLKGITNSLEYIKSLGANAIWMTPLFNSVTGDVRGQATGYFADDYYNVDPNFGTNQDLRDLINKAHSLGMYVFLDGVFGHHGANPISGVVDGAAQWYGSEIVYPSSLEYFKNVATYWIEEYGIDGWRLDQAYQLYQNGHNYWHEIKAVVESAAQARKDRGEEWGTLGYMVGEIWKGQNEINQEGYSQDGLESCFDFPMRYSLVQVLATQEHTDQSGAYGQPASVLNQGLASHDIYPSYAHPNLMLTNHDLVRFGDLIQRAPNLGYGKENSDYWKRYKAAYSFMAAYTGPITIYYGDEIGREVEGFIYEGDLGYYDDHVSRDNGKISGLTTEENDLKDYIAQLMNMRAEHPALWNGDRTNLIANQTQYADLKIDLETGEKIVYVLNTGTQSTTISISSSQIGGNKLVDLLSGDQINNSGTYYINVDGLSGRFLLIQ
ncbi:alpha-amylase family glycosyl hydrolase [Orenia metallireducens]|nr:alpha-amylase family glycosyl hydrolase [Orenia metallireducens]